MLLFAKKRNAPSTDPNAGYVNLYVDLATGKLMALDEAGNSHEYVVTTDLSVYALASALSNYALASALSDYVLKANVLDLFKVTRTLGDNYVHIVGPDTETTFVRGTVHSISRDVAIDATSIIHVTGIIPAEKASIYNEEYVKIRISGTSNYDGIYEYRVGDLFFIDEIDGTTTISTSMDEIGISQSGDAIITSGESYIQRIGDTTQLPENYILKVTGADETYDGLYTIDNTDARGTYTRYYVKELLPSGEAVLECNLDYWDGTSKNYTITHNLNSVLVRISGYMTMSTEIPVPIDEWLYFDNKDAFFTIIDENSIVADTINTFADGDTIILVIEKLD